MGKPTPDNIGKGRKVVNNEDTKKNLEEVAQLQFILAIIPYIYEQFIPQKTSG
jgi:hypothetical protein